MLPFCSWLDRTGRTLPRIAHHHLNWRRGDRRAMMVDLRPLLSNPGLTAFEAERGLVVPMPTWRLQTRIKSKEGHYRVRLDGEWDGGHHRAKPSWPNNGLAGQGDP